MAEWFCYFPRFSFWPNFAKKTLAKMSKFKVMYKIILVRLKSQLVAMPTADPGAVSLILAWSHICMKIDHEIFFPVILLFSLIQEGLLSVTSKSTCTNT